MWIWTTKIDRRKLAGMLAAGVVLCAVLGSAFFIGQGAAQTSSTVPRATGIRTSEDRCSYLASWGWLVSGEAASVEELELPDPFGEEYADYLALQSAQGFDLTRYAGKRVKRYTYDILNYPGQISGVQAQLVICRNTVIAGEIVGENIFHGLALPE